MTRSLTMVKSCGSLPSSVAMPSRSSSARILRAGSSSPTTVSSVVRAPSARTLTATLPAPPRHSSSRLKRTTGTGASGEMRSTAPNQ